MYEALWPIACWLMAWVGGCGLIALYKGTDEEG